MELSEIKTIQTPEQISYVITEARFQKPSVNYQGRALFWKEVLEQYDPKLHKIMDDKPDARPDKYVNIPDPLNPGATFQQKVKVSRIPLSFQHIIVDRAVSFTCGDGIEMTADTKDELGDDFLTAVKKTWQDNKMQYRISELCRRMISETECALLWYQDDAGDGYWDDTIMADSPAYFQLRTKVLSPSLGDELLPMWDAGGDLIAFGRHFFTRGLGNARIENFAIYTDESTREFSTQNQGAWALVKETPNNFKKIPVIWFSQPEPEWLDVQALIERQETLKSNFADTNDYNGSPILAVTGNVSSMSAKGEAGKVVELDPNSKIEYVTWNQAPHAIELEMTGNDEKIYTLTQTPNISFDSLKSLSLGRLTGVAIKFLFMDAQMKAVKKQQGSFGEGIQRCINFIKHGLVCFNPALMKQENVYIQPVFSNYLPADEMQSINDIVAAVMAGILSLQTAIELNPLVANPITELLRIKAEQADKEALLQQQMEQAQQGAGAKKPLSSQLNE